MCAGPEDLSSRVACVQECRCACDNRRRRAVPASSQCGSRPNMWNGDLAWWHGAVVRDRTVRGRLFVEGSRGMSTTAPDPGRPIVVLGAPGAARDALQRSLLLAPGAWDAGRAAPWDTGPHWPSTSRGSTPRSSPTQSRGRSSSSTTSPTTGPRCPRSRRTRCSSCSTRSPPSCGPGRRTRRQTSGPGSRRRPPPSTRSPSAPRSRVASSTWPTCWPRPRTPSSSSSTSSSWGGTPSPRPRGATWPPSGPPPPRRRAPRTRPSRTWPRGREDWPGPPSPAWPPPPHPAASPPTTTGCPSCSGRSGAR